MLPVTAVSHVGPEVGFSRHPLARLLPRLGEVPVIVTDYINLNSPPTSAKALA